MPPSETTVGTMDNTRTLERHGVDIEFESQEGKGSLFTFELPTDVKDIPRENKAFASFFEGIAALPPRTTVRPGDPPAGES